MEASYPILEFDPETEAVIEPAKAVRERDMPERLALCFFREVIEQTVSVPPVEKLAPFVSEMGHIPIHAIQYEGVSVAVAQCPVGAPLAVGLLEEAIARGARMIVACGGAGVLDKAIVQGAIVLPTSALREEGTSYHYMPPSREALPSPRIVDALRAVLNRHGAHYCEGRTWTTDAFYRETRGKVARRRGEGCLTVEMEAAALFAAGGFRGCELGMLLSGGDDVSGPEWDPRDHGDRKLPARERLFWLCVEALSAL